MNNYFFKPSKLLQSTLTLLILLGSDDYILDSGGPLFVQADQPVHCKSTNKAININLNMSNM